MFLTASDLRRLSSFLGISDQDFFQSYCEVVDLHLAKRVSLVAQKGGACVFHAADGCEVYARRPLQCRTYPFWVTNVSDRRSWNRVKRKCPGVNRGKRWTSHQIVRLIERREREPLLDLT